jgi:hypothetical protein
LCYITSAEFHLDFSSAIFSYSALEELNDINSRVLYFKLYSVDETVDNGIVSGLKIEATKMILTIQWDVN